LLSDPAKAADRSRQRGPALEANYSACVTTRRTFRELVLGSSAGWRLFKALTGSDKTVATMADLFVTASPGERVLDVGCGYGDLARYLTDVEYVGVDISERYIEFARRQEVTGATYVVGDVTELSEERFGGFDCAVMIGVLHHLSDAEATTTLKAMSSMLKASGRMVAIEPVWDPDQRTTARVLAALDRGRYVRDQIRYEALVSPWYSRTSSEVRHDLFWFPYSHCIVRAALD
jgi:2-polyprenyl-3-methyl-5-hydroxy-6-metoxy-1,4-benzoquinol methylase